MYQEMINCEIEVPKLDSDYDTLFVLYDIFGIVMVSDIDDGEMAEYLRLDAEDVVLFGMVEYDVDLIYVNGKVHSYSARPEDELDAKRYPDFETFIKVLHETWEKAQPKKSGLTNKIGQKFIDKVQKEAPSFVQEAYYPPKDLDRFKSHIAKCESIIGRSLPDGYKRLLESGIEDIGIKGADGWFQGCEWGLIESSLRDRGKYDYAGHPGAEFIPLANNGRGDEILMGNKSKTDTRIFTYVHDAKNGLKQIAKSWDEFEKLLYTIKESDSKYDTTNMNFFGKEYKVRIPRGISLESTYKALDIVKNSEKLLNDSVRKQIRDYMESWKSEMSESELKSADWEHPEKHLRPAYVYANDRSSKWDTMIDCDWDFDNEHGLAIIFGNNMKFKDVSQAGNYL
jgi:hypothetical protein